MLVQSLLPTSCKMVLYDFNFYQTIIIYYIALHLPRILHTEYDRSKSDLVISEPTMRRERVCRSDETNTQ